MSSGGRRRARTADFNDLTADGGTTGKGLEVYLSGNVVVWMGAKADLDPSGRPQQYRIVRADRVYYDVTNHRAIANNADMEFTRRGYVNTAHVTSPEIRQLSSSEFSADDARFSASRLPSDPGLAVRFDRVEIYREPLIYRETIFGKLFRDRFTGEPVAERPEIVEASDITTEVLGVPVWYWPFIRTDVNDPTGPFRGASISQNNLFGFQVYLNWDMLKLIGITPLKNERWTLLTDYLSRRGPALGTNYSLAQEKFFGLDAPFQTQVKAYAIYDKGTDILAGNRENEFQPTQLRGRFQFRHQQEFEDWTFQGQLACLSDHNFLEQYYKLEFDSGPNQETFAWLKYQSGNAGATILAEPALGRPWMNEANWLPRADGYLLGQSLFDRFTYHTWGNVGYADLRTWRPPVEQYPPPALFPTAYAFPPAERGLTTARADWMQQISAPFDLGPARVVPYGVLDLAYYTEDNNGGSLGRIYGGGGVRASVPLSKLYPDVGSELFNLNGLYHKNLFSLNYYLAGSSASYLNTPQLDRLNDDAVQQAYQDIIPWEPTFPQLQPNGQGYALAAGSYERFNPRLYAIRRLVDFNPDHRDDIHELQLGLAAAVPDQAGLPGAGAHRRLADGGPVGLRVPGQEPGQLRVGRRVHRGEHDLERRGPERAVRQRLGGPVRVRHPVLGGGELFLPGRPDQSVPRLQARGPDPEPARERVGQLRVQPEVRDDSPDHVRLRLPVVSDEQLAVHPRGHRHGGDRRVLLQLRGQGFLAGAEHRPEPDRQPAVTGALPVRRVRGGGQPVRVQPRRGVRGGGGGFGR